MWRGLKRVINVLKVVNPGIVKLVSSSGPGLNCK
jgi:hypothetical protein